MSASTRYRTLRARVRGDEGAAGVEYAGAIMVVVAVVLSLVVVATPVGQTIAARLCEAFGTSCGSTTAQDPDREPDKPCVTNTSTTSMNANLSVAFIDIGGERSVMVEELSDRTFRVTVAGEAALQAVLSSPEAYFTASVLDHGVMGGVTGSIGAGLMAGGGLEYRFSDKKAADDFQAWLTRQAVKEGLTVAGSAVNPGMKPVVGAGVEVVDWLWRKVTGDDYSPPAPNATYVEGGVVATANGSVGDLVSGAAGSARGENVLGVKMDEDGSTTVYTRVQMTAEGLAQVGLSHANPYVGTGGSFDLGAELVVSTTVDADGQLVKVGLDGAATAEGATTLTALFGAPPLAGGKGARLSAEFPVTRENRRQVHASIQAITRGALTGVSPSVGTTVAAPFIFHEAARNGEVTAQYADLSSTNLANVAVGLKAPAVGGLGFGVGAGTTQAQTTSGEYLTPTGWKEWSACAA